MVERAFKYSPDVEPIQMERIVMEAQKLQTSHEQDASIFQALTNAGVRDRATRVQLFKQIKKKLKQLESSGSDRITKDLPFSERTDLLADAIAHEKRQPSETYADDEQE